MTLRVGHRTPVRTFPPPPKQHPDGKSRREVLLEKAIAAEEEARRQAEAERQARAAEIAAEQQRRKAARKAAVARTLAPLLAGVGSARKSFAAAASASGRSITTLRQKTIDAWRAFHGLIRAALRRAVLVARLGARLALAGLRRMDPRPYVMHLGRALLFACRAIAGAVRSLVLGLLSAVFGAVRGVMRGALAVAHVLALIGQSTWLTMLATLRTITEFGYGIWKLLRSADPRPIIQAARSLLETVSRAVLRRLLQAWQVVRQLATWLAHGVARSWRAIADIVTMRRIAATGYAAAVAGAVYVLGPVVLDNIENWQLAPRETVLMDQRTESPPPRVAVAEPRVERAPAQQIVVPRPEPTTPKQLTAARAEPPVPPVETAAPVNGKISRQAALAPTIQPPETPLERSWELPKAAPDGRARVAIVIDDMGMVQEILPDMLALPGPITFSFLPYSPNLKQQTRRTLKAGHELMVHLPMEPKRRTANPGPQALLTALQGKQLAERINWNLERFDGYTGINNHMGSLFTEDEEGMRAVIAELKARNLFFLDSVTTSESVGYSLAGEFGVPRARRDIFLDNNRTYRDVMHQLEKLEAKALENGHAVAIGHPYQVTHQALRDWLPSLAGKGIEVVAMSKLLERPAPTDPVPVQVARKIEETIAPAAGQPAAGFSIAGGGGGYE